METKNVIAAISLSAAVIILYSLFFAPEPVPRSQNISEKNKIEKNSDAPSLEQKDSIIKISRDEAIIENKNLSSKLISFSKVIPCLLVQDNFIGDFSVRISFPTIDQTVSELGISIFLSVVTNPLSIK